MKNIFTSKLREPSGYKGLPELATAGLHPAAFELFRKYVSPPAKVLDLGSGRGAWPKRLHDASYSVTGCDLQPPTDRLDFPCHAIDLNQNFGEAFGDGQFDAVTIVEVIEHLENPRHVFRQIKSLLKPGGVVIVTTPNASGLYSRLRFFFTGQMAMFNDDSYRGCGHITPMTAWQLETIFKENNLRVVERRFHDGPFLPPRSSGDFAKIAAWLVFRALMFGTVGGQIILYLLKKDE